MSSNNSRGKKVNLKEKRIQQFRKEISKMNYQKANEELDIILDNLRMEEVPIEELYEYHMKGNLLAEHCKNLLSTLEQEIVEINSDHELDSLNY
tara:strand:- start:17133 stop:17414 length:282 start_codon:yes stop_codon:yes gene_type:complete